MSRKNVSYMLLSVFILFSFLIKLALIHEYKNLLTLSSDDLNYFKSAVFFLKKGVFTFHNYNEPTVFITPVYPLFLAGILKICGYGLGGIQAVRVVQAAISCLSILFVFLISKEIFGQRVALLSAFLVSFYIPNVTTTGYLLTETLFVTLLYLLIYISIKFSGSPSFIKFSILGIVLAVTTLCRPTIAMFPALLCVYLILYRKYNLIKLIKYNAVLAFSFLLILTPWWIRNYNEYGKFIPLSASSGNPMLQGTYIQYKQTPEEAVVYDLGKNALETDKIEVKIAKTRIVNGFKKNFWGYLKWYTLDKTGLFWVSPFYWKSVWNINYYMVLAYHWILLTGFVGIFILLLNRFYKAILLISTVVYFNIVHCLYMTFDRYAFPLMPILAIFCSYFIVESIFIIKEKTYKKF